MKKFQTFATALTALTMSISASAAQSAVRLHCAYTNDGFGGDEGYEISISESATGLVATLTVIDPSGGFDYATVPVTFKTVRGLPTYIGENFRLALLTSRPLTEDGYRHARYRIMSEFDSPQSGHTLCK